MCVFNRSFFNMSIYQITMYTIIGLQFCQLHLNKAENNLMKRIT